MDSLLMKEIIPALIAIQVVKCAEILRHQKNVQNVNQVYILMNTKKINVFIVIQIMDSLFKIMTAKNVTHHVKNVLALLKKIAYLVRVTYTLMKIMYANNALKIKVILQKGINAKSATRIEAHVKKVDNLIV